MAEYLSESYGYEFVYEDEIEGGEYDRNHDHHNSTAADPKKEHQEEGGVFTTMKNTVKQVASNIVKTDSEKLAVSEALLRWIDAKNGSAKDNIVANVSEHKVRRLYRLWLKYMTALMTIGHFLFFILMVSAVNSRFHFGHVAFPLASILFAFGGYPIWTQKTSRRLSIPRMHTMLVIFYVGVGIYTFAYGIAHAVWIFNVKAQADHFCSDRAASFLCAPNGVSKHWLRAVFVMGWLLSGSAIITAGMFIMRYTFVYIIFLEWSWIRHHIDSATDTSATLRVNKFIFKSGALLVRIGVKLKRGVRSLCHLNWLDQDSEAEHASVPPSTTVPVDGDEQQEDLLSYDASDASAPSGEEQEEEEESGWGSSGSRTNSGEELASLCLISCCCIYGCVSLLGCIALTGAAREISCIIFFIVVESA